MSKYLLIVIIFLTLLCGSCSNDYKKGIDDKINGALSKQIEDGTIELPELLVQNKLNIMLMPLVVGVFTGIVLTFSGIRVIGIGVITASVTCIILIVTMSLYMKYVAIIGLLVLLVGLFFLGKHLYESAMINRQLVGAVEAAKTLIPSEKIDILKKTLLNSQHKATKKLVSKIKK
jgi:hypothetical protein